MISYSLLMQIFFMNKCTGTMRRTMKWGHSVPEHVRVRLMLLWLCPWGWCSPSCRRSLPHAFWEAVLMAEETRRCWFAGCLAIERQFLTVWSALERAIWIQQWFCCWKGTQKISWWLYSWHVASDIFSTSNWFLLGVWLHCAGPLQHEEMVFNAEMSQFCCMQIV